MFRTMDSIIFVFSDLRRTEKGHRQELCKTCQCSSITYGDLVEEDRTRLRSAQTTASHDDCSRPMASTIATPFDFCDDVDATHLEPVAPDRRQETGQVLVWSRESLVLRDPRHPDLSRALMECRPDDEMVAGNVEPNVRKPEGTNLTETALVSSVDVCRTELSRALLRGTREVERAAVGRRHDVPSLGHRVAGPGRAVA